MPFVQLIVHSLGLNQNSQMSREKKYKRDFFLYTKVIHNATKIKGIQNIYKGEFYLLQ